MRKGTIQTEGHRSKQLTQTLQTQPCHKAQNETKLATVLDERRLGGTLLNAGCDRSSNLLNLISFFNTYM